MTDQLTADTIDGVVQHIEPIWDVQTATPAVEGAHMVSHLEIETERGARECVLKATPPEREPTCDGETRLLAVFDAHTDLPVPEVLGVVDDHDEWPTPLFLASTLPGANYNRTELREFDTGAVGTLARSTGHHLAALHGFDAYGFVGVEDSETPDGGRPSVDTARITVEDPVVGRIDRRVRDNYDYYRLLVAVHAMLNFESWFVDLDVVAGDDDQLDAAIRPQSLSGNLREVLTCPISLQISRRVTKQVPLETNRDNSRRTVRRRQIFSGKNRENDLSSISSACSSRSGSGTASG